MTAVDWSRPIEAVHDTGLVHAAHATPQAGGERWWVTWPANATWSDARGALDPEWHGWRIRNVQPTTAERDPALWDRMVALVRRMAGNSSMGEPYEEDRVITYSSDHYCEARAIVADLPKPVDPDLIEARRLVPPHVPSWGPDDHARCVDGEFDANLFVIIALAAIKRGRELAGEQA